MVIFSFIKQPESILPLSVPSVPRRTPLRTRPHPRLFPHSWECCHTYIPLPVGAWRLHRSSKCSCTNLLGHCIAPHSPASPGLDHKGCHCIFQLEMWVPYTVGLTLRLIQSHLRMTVLRKQPIHLIKPNPLWSDHREHSAWQETWPLLLRAISSLFRKPST